MIFSVFKRIERGVLTSFFFAFGFCGIVFAQASVCFDQNCFYPEVAETAAQKQKGLMGRESLAKNEGMLFVYDKNVRPAFWMKNVRMALDFVWLDDQGVVVDLHQDIPPCGETCPSIVSRHPLKYVLEVTAGTAQKSGIEIGDRAVIKLGVTHAD